MLQYVLVFVGGGLGSVCRFGISHFLIDHKLDFPFATLIANAFACIVLGFFMGMHLKEGVHHTHRMMVMTGFCGGFSTFSTFTGETLQLFQSGQLLLGFLNIIVSLTVCLVCLYLGMKMA